MPYAIPKVTRQFRQWLWKRPDAPSGAEVFVSDPAALDRPGEWAATLLFKLRVS
jgi:hypothetical protein